MCCSSRHKEINCCDKHFLVKSNVSTNFVSTKRKYVVTKKPAIEMRFYFFFVATKRAIVATKFKQCRNITFSVATKIPTTEMRFYFFFVVTKRTIIATKFKQCRDITFFVTTEFCSTSKLCTFSYFQPFTTNDIMQ